MNFEYFIYIYSIRCLAKNSHTELLEVVKHGTKESPVVSALMKVTYTVSSMTKTTQSSKMYHIIGDGRIIPLQ